LIFAMSGVEWMRDRINRLRKKRNEGSAVDWREVDAEISNLEATFARMQETSS
jgi:hypothetical protein